ncbi:mll9325 (plasmid) [Mesorhizobium japonicum MAFF 303099]|uniref:Mll9325 protein n=1 Tax=Mesorhizobium japonicum (strain LMG 29417 / CECT 9101 / MAFF 303099) TaxID=266835 RepID=Q981L5_RHILO|nr:mll9325 [Mesorhizobium japonicum MAFF 303099]
MADETNFSKDKRHRFLSRAATAAWDAIIITHSAFRFIGVPSAFEQQMIHDELELYERLLTKVESDDRVSRKRLERLKEGLKERLEALATRKDDLLTISEIGVDQIIVDEAQEFSYAQIDIMCSSPCGVKVPAQLANAELHIIKLECLQELHQGVGWPIAGSPSLQRLETRKSALLH